MRLDEPTPEMVRAVKAGVAWFQTAQVEGYRYQKRAPELPALVRDRSARPLWARFYEIETQRPIFSDRDGVVSTTSSRSVASDARGTRGTVPGENACWKILLNGRTGIDKQ